MLYPFYALPLLRFTLLRFTPFTLYPFYALPLLRFSPFTHFTPLPLLPALPLYLDFGLEEAHSTKF